MLNSQRNITNMALKVRDSNLKVNEVESKINQIEDIAMGADRAAKQSTRIAETLMDSIQESFTQACFQITFQNRTKMAPLQRWRLRAVKDVSQSEDSVLKTC